MYVNLGTWIVNTHLICISGYAIKCYTGATDSTGNLDPLSEITCAASFTTCQVLIKGKKMQ